MSGLHSPRVSVFSTENLVEQATITATSSNSAYPVSNLLFAGTPFVKWQSADLTTAWVQILMPVISSVERLVVYLGNTNFTTVMLAAGHADLYSAVSDISQIVTIKRNPINWRYQGAWVLPRTYNLPYLFVYIAPQSVIDGQPGYSIGDLWVGLVNDVDLSYDVGYTTVMPRKLIEADSKAFTESLIMGEPRARLSVTRRARITRLTPGVNDDFRMWTEIDRKTYISGGLILPTVADPTMAFIVRQVGEYSWTRNRLNYMESHMDLDEIVGP